MDFDFAQTYKSYTTKALLHILAEPHKYQPAAVAAAQAILDSRVVTDAERAEAAAALNPAAKPRRAKLPTFSFPARAEVPYESNSIFAEEELTPIELKAINLWRWLVAAAVGLPTALLVFYLLRNFFEAFTSRNAEYAAMVYSGMWYTFIFTAVPIVSIILFLKNKRWGWACLAAYTAYQVASYSTGFIITAAFRNFRSYAYINIIFMALAGSALYLLWRWPMRRYYAISRRVALQVAITAAAVSAGIKLFAIAFFMFR